ncbi:substrate-binding domain-containing protein [Armatimonas rosea]|uniref:Ribose transport system substrate-binding protein n=1 Tax=Armatimonas rosea TaxID=685828 RepID=A0A7W9SKI6_ARMRO|nr:substrate-binding domain-containing protein [Armatimonas rosea]MBB6048312.1 ribose transport system substrate-binding protein [Armatimonas rosea]
MRILTTRRSALFSLGAVALTLLVGCDQKPATTGGDTPAPAGGTAPAPAGGKLTLAVIPKGMTHVFWQSVKAGAEKAGAELGAEIKWVGAQKETDTAGQIGVVENQMTAKVDGIALAPLDKAALVPVIKKAHEAKVPLVIFDSAADVSDDQYVSFVATDNRVGGEMAAKQMGKICGGKGKVVLVPNAANSASTMDREAGFEETIKKEFPGMTVIRSNYGESDRSKSLNVSQDVLSANPDVVGIFGSCEPCAIGALKAVEAKGLKGKVKIIGFDNTTEMEKGITEGTIDSVVIQNPAKMGYESVKALIAAKKGEKVEKKIDTGVVLMTKENMDKDEMKDFRAK